MEGKKCVKYGCSKSTDSYKTCSDCNKYTICFDCIRGKGSFFSNEINRKKDNEWINFKKMTDEELINYQYKCDNCFGCRFCNNEKERNECKSCINCNNLTCFDCVRNVGSSRWKGGKFTNMTDDELTAYNFKCKECFWYYFYASISCKIDGEVKTLSGIIKLDHYPSEYEIKEYLIKEKERFSKESKIAKVCNTADLISYSQITEKMYRAF